jgi:hypothetical protein
MHIIEDAIRIERLALVALQLIEPKPANNAQLEKAFLEALPTALRLLPGLSTVDAAFFPTRLHRRVRRNLPALKDAKHLNANCQRPAVPEPVRGDLPDPVACRN